MKSLKISVFGLVQGVGFRPFVYSLALKFNLKGEVYNDDEGVKISIYGNQKNCDDFINALKSNLPPLARIDDIKITPNDKKFDDFRIISSKNTRKFAAILPDFAICDECKNEFYDKKNRRYHHPFINCTNCGPRFSIIKSLPYDRKNTTMTKFEMCELCKKEYLDPQNRRYHAQPIACNNCGPKVFLRDLNAQILAQSKDAIIKASNAIKNGKIIAVKGLGGFHLVCDATNKNAVNLLRTRKNRPHKPFAIMVKDENMAKKLAQINKFESQMLNSNLKPIVLLESQTKELEWLAPNLDKIGLFIAPTSLHLLLFEYLDFPLVATSANISGEPIITSFDDICQKLGGVVDLVLDNDRDILNPSDDSICFCIDEQALWIRTSRGIKPQIKKSNLNKNSCILALGSELKNQFAIYKDGLIFSSPYIGDLGNIASIQRYLSLIHRFCEIYEFKFDSIIGDLHPNFHATKHFENHNFQIQKLQHHKSHIYSVAFENSVNSDFLGFAFDGTGYGEDGIIWGGEVFLGTNLNNTPNLQRIAHFDEFAMIGSQKAIKNIFYLTHAILQKYELKAEKFYGRFSKNEIVNLNAALKNAKIHTTSLGRVFDAFACLVCGINEITYEAQAPMILESLYDENISVCYDFDIQNGVINFKNAFKRAINDDKITAATGFINGIAKLIADLAILHQKPVILSGGVFLNKALLKQTINLLKQANLEYYLPQNCGVGDENIALGQLFWALKQ
nr:carbamoyltransferase HypF [Campylobacter sp.]